MGTLGGVFAEGQNQLNPLGPQSIRFSQIKQLESGDPLGSLANVRESVFSPSSSSEVGDQPDLNDSEIYMPPSASGSLTNLISSDDVNGPALERLSTSPSNTDVIH